MAWTKLDDRFSEHPKVLAVGPLGMVVHVRAMGYVARNLTDGFIPSAIVSTFTAGFDSVAVRRASLEVDSPASETMVDASSVDWPRLLVDAGLWERARGGFRIHDHLEYNPRREQVEADRKATAQRVARWRAGRKTDGNGTGNAVTNTGVTPPVTVPPYPSPTPPEREQVLSPPETPRRQRARQTELLPTSPAAKAGPIDAYWSAFQVRYGFAPTATKAEIAATQTALRNVPEPDRARLLTAFVEDDKPFLCEAAHALRLFPGELNRLKARLAGTLSAGRSANGSHRPAITPPSFRAEDEPPGTSKLDGIPVEEL